MSKKSAIVLGLLVCGAIILFGVAPFFWIGDTPNGLWQNLANVGQFVSGVFAPLAFVGLLVAVFLQSKELELQRIELRDTREVLELQKEEMKRAADENREQTRIMTENLKSDAERKLYEEIDIRLYSLALYAVSNHSNSIVDLGSPRRGHLYIVRFEPDFETGINRNNFDRAYLIMFGSIRNFALNMENYNGYSPHPKGREFFEYLYRELSFIGRTKKHLDNQQINARLRGLQLPDMLDQLDKIGNKVFASQ